MGCSADDMVMWKDFPKGLRVLLVGDSTSTAETKSRLEAMDYIVSLYCDEKDALEAITSKTENFHVAILEVTTDNTYGSFRFLEMAKDLPTIVTSSVPCISTTVKWIALGAAEFLQKPLSEDKLRNIWHHLVHKAFNAGGDVLSKSLEPIKETLVSMLQLQSDKDETENEFTFKSEIKQEDREKVHLNTNENDSLSARSTPQLVKGGRFMEDGDFHARAIFSIEKENIANSKYLSVVKKCTHSETKSIDNTCNNLNSTDRNNKEVLNANSKKAAVEEEVDSTDGSRTEESIVVKGSQASDVHDMDNIKSVTDDLKKRKSSHDTTSCSHGNRGSRKKIKVDWTSELHKQFVRAVEQLGIDQAIPSKILELMKVEGLTRHNIASHLQKYRMHRRHILPKDSDRRWQPPMHRDSMLRGFMPRPPMVFPPFQSNYGLPPTQVYPVWGHPSYHHPAVPVWGYPGLSTSTWHPTQGSWLCKTYPGIQASEWGFPIVPSYSQSSIPTQSTTMDNSLDAMGGRSRDMKDFSEFYLKDEVIDEVVQEAMSKPWLPLPLGLKPPSTDSVLTELHRQGIRTIPPLHR